MFDPSFQAALAITVVGLVILVLVQLFVPLRRGRALEQELQAAGITIHQSGRADSGSFREWELPLQVNGVLEGLCQELAAVPGAQAPRLDEGRLILPGRPLRFLNVNRVNPLDFRHAEFRVRSGSPSVLVTRADFGGYWRAIAVVLLFTAWGGFIVWLSSRRLKTFEGVLAVLLVFAVVFLTVHYYSHRLTTRNFFDDQVLKAVRRATKTTSRAA